MFSYVCMYACMYVFVQRVCIALNKTRMLENQIAFGGLAQDAAVSHRVLWWTWIPVSLPAKN